jgi:hypothetical protein
MKKTLFILVFSLLCSNAWADLTMTSLKQLVQPLHLGYSTYFSDFADKAGYGGPWILTKDGGGAAFGDNVVYKFDPAGKETWKKQIKNLHDESECQSIAEDGKGNLYAFLLTYNRKAYRGGVERVVSYDKNGKLLWDKLIGKFSPLNNPIVSYIKPAADGRIYVRGHLARDKKRNGDPRYLFWEGWLDATSKLTQKTGEEIDWKKPEWQKRFQPE